MTRRSVMDRRALIASGAAAALLTATGVSAQTRPTRGGRMRAALSGARRDDLFDSRQAHGTFMQVAMAGAVFDTLTEIAADGTLRGELATHWHGAPDARTWRLELRKDVVFHHGKPLEASDVAASFELHRTSLLADVTRMTALETHVLQVELAGEDTDFPYRLSDPRLVVYPGDDLSAAMQAGIGTGLYRVHRFQPGRQVLGHRVETHYKDGRAGWFDEIELVSLPSGAVRAEALRDAYVDVVDLTHTSDLGDMARIKTLPNCHVISTAVADRLCVPRQVGAHRPLDNLRAAERWWMA